MLLEAVDIVVRYGPVTALSDASFGVDSGEVVAMIGPNGAGKSSALKAVAGLLDFYSGALCAGKITFAGQEIAGLSADRLAALGIAIVPEGRRIFGSMTVAENLELGGYALSRRIEVRENTDRVLEIFPPLKTLLRRTAGTLSGGEQQMLAISRALMLKPQLLLADEPSLGLSPNFVEIIGEKLQTISRSGTSILLVEQNVSLALHVSHRTYVFEMGRIAYTGISSELASSFDFAATFLGRSSCDR